MTKILFAPALILFCVTSTVACNGQMSSQTQFSAVSHVGAQTAFSAFAKITTLPLYSEKIATMRSKTYSDIYQNTVKNSSNDLVSIDNYVFEGLHDRSVAMENDFLNVSTKFATQGEYWDQIGFDPHQSLTLDDLENALDLFDRLQQIDINNITTADYSQANKDLFFSDAGAIVAAKGGLILSLAGGAGLSGSQSSDGASSSLALEGNQQNLQAMSDAATCLKSNGYYCPGYAGAPQGSSSGNVIIINNQQCYNGNCDYNNGINNGSQSGSVTANGPIGNGNANGDDSTVAETSGASYTNP